MSQEHRAATGPAVVLLGQRGTLGQQLTGMFSLEKEEKKKGSMLVQPPVASRYTDLGPVRDLSSGCSLWKLSYVVSVGQVSIEM